GIGPEAVTLEIALPLIAAKAGSNDKAGAKQSAAKKTAAKKTAAKKAAPKKAPAKTKANAE
ncbi:MAG: hypothetical protein ACK58O_13500, partial [Brevundimonas sp.]